MFDFTAIKNAIIHDIKPICIQNYLILSEINILPKELVKNIIYCTFELVDEIVMLKEDIILLEKDSLFQLISTCFNPCNNIDILFPEYNKYISMDINDIQHRFAMTNCIKFDSEIIICTEKLYVLNKNIFDLLFNRYCGKNDSYKRVYIENYQRNIQYYINKMKISKEYSSSIKNINK
jgi:hypothetical protein